MVGRSLVGLWLLVMQVAFLTATALPVRACSCAGPVGSGSVEAADAVFTGTPIRFDHGPTREFDHGASQEIVAAFEVHSSTKGDVGNEVGVFAGFDNIVGGCLYPFEIGQTYRVFARRMEDRNLLTAGLCSGTHRISATGAETEEGGVSPTPSASPASRALGSDEAGSAGPMFVGLGALGVAAPIAYFILGRRTRDAGGR